MSIGQRDRRVENGNGIQGYRGIGVSCYQIRERERERERNPHCFPHAHRSRTHPTCQLDSLIPLQIDWLSLFSWLNRSPKTGISSAEFEYDIGERERERENKVKGRDENPSSFSVLERVLVKRDRWERETLSFFLIYFMFFFLCRN